MKIPDEYTLRNEKDIEKMLEYDDPYSTRVPDIMLLHNYGQKVFSQNGLGLCGWQLRQRDGNFLMTIKVVDSGVPLVAFISSHTATGCVEKLWSLFEADKINWRRDAYPWI